MSDSYVRFRCAEEKKKEMQDAAKRDGVSLTAYIIGLHNSEIRKRAELNSLRER